MKSGGSEYDDNKDSSYYLSSPWITENIGWYFLSLPEKLVKNKSAFDKDKKMADELFKEYMMYNIDLKNFHVFIMYFDVKENFYQEWDLDKSVKSAMNNCFYTLGCAEIQLTKIKPFNDKLEVVYSGESNCSKLIYKSKTKAIRDGSYILTVSTIYKEDDLTLEKMSDRIINSIENKNH